VTLCYLVHISPETPKRASDVPGSARVWTDEESILKSNGAFTVAAMIAISIISRARRRHFSDPLHSLDPMAFARPVRTTG
jgi:hypothetical protein